MERIQTRRSDTSASPSTNKPPPIGNNLDYVSTQAFDPLAPFRLENQVGPAPEGHFAQCPYLSIPSTPSPTLDESVSRHLIERNGNEGDPADNESIQELEHKLKALRGYATNMLELSLMEFRARILNRVSQLEDETERQK
ncbi:hypothetical protein BDW67DRAFT_56200 [Aspergillus spinulosporus]